MNPDEVKISPFDRQPGQAEETPDLGITPEAPATAEGQTEGPEIRDAAPTPPETPTAEPSFTDIDLSTLPPEIAAQVEATKKLMQADYTRKTQAIAQDRQKVDAMNAFLSNPLHPDNQRFLAQYGYVLPNQSERQATQSNEPYEPQSWEELLTKAAQMGRDLAMQEMAPITTQMQQMGVERVMSRLNQIDPDWRKYEAEMMQLLNQYPQMAREPDKLYRLAVPPEVMEARIFKTISEKYKGQAQHASTHTKPSAPRSKPGRPKVSNFEEAFALAQQQVKSGEA